MPNITAHPNKFLHFISLIKKSFSGAEYDYTRGSLKTAILLLAVPMILELSLESVFALVDIFFVGKLGENAIATVGLTESVITIVYSTAIGLSTAATAVVARRIGEKNPEGAAYAGMQSILLCLICTVVMSTAGILFAPKILGLMGASPEVVATGSGFTRIMLGSSLFIMMLFLINGIFRGAGNAAIAMKSLWLASIINIILCPTLINGWGPFPKLGLEGAAIATSIGRGVGVLYQCYHLFNKKGIIRITNRHFKWNPTIVKSLMTVAGPAILQFMIASGSWIVLARLVAETGGTEASAGYQVAIRNVVFFILPAWGVSNAAATLVGQNLGANQPLRAEQSVLLTARYNAIFMAVVSLLFIFFSAPIIAFFSKDPAVQRFGAAALQIVGFGYIFYGIGMVMMAALNGAGDSKTPTLINFTCFWLFQVPLAYLLAKGFHMGPIGAFIAIPVAETSIAIAAFIVFKKGRWKKVVL
ncbi:MAG: MATE family efflux transporter [Chitinophagaceae bacterium]